VLPHELKVVTRKKPARRGGPGDEPGASQGGGAAADPSESSHPTAGSGNPVDDGPTGGADPKSEATVGWRGQARQETGEAGARESGQSKGTSQLQALREKYMLTNLPQFNPDNMLQWLKHDMRLLREPGKKKTKVL